MGYEVVYYDVLEDRLNIHITAEWAGDVQQQIKVIVGEDVVYHQVYIGEL